MNLSPCSIHLPASLFAYKLNPKFFLMNYNALHFTYCSFSEGGSLFLVSCLSCLSVQSLNRVRLLATPWIAARQDSLSITKSQSLPKLMSIESVMPSNHFNLCHPLVLPSSIFLVNESLLHIRWPNYWSFSFSISPSNEYSGLISFRLDWLDLLAVQGTLRSLLQHHSSKASILWCSLSL